MAIGRCVVLAEGVSNDAIDDALMRAGFQLVNLVTRTEVHPRQRVYARRDGAAYVHDVQDHVLGARYLALSGAESDAIETALSGDLAVRRVDSLLELTEHADRAVAVQALRLLGVAVAGRVPEVARSAFRRAMAGDDASLREAAAAAVGFAERSADGGAP
jgi:hypothetical protein